MKKIILGIFILHFSVIIISVLGNIHVFPNGLVKDISNLYSVPFFEQNWGMFSNPPTTTKKVYFQYHIPEIGTDRVIITDWYDVNSSMYNYNKEHFFSVAQRLIKYESSCLNSIFQSIDKCKDPTPDVCIEYTPGFIALRSYAKIIYANSMGIPVDQFEFSEMKFVIKVVEEHFPNFEHRHMDYFSKENFEYGIHTTIPYPLG